MSGDEHEHDHTREHPQAYGHTQGRNHRHHFEHGNGPRHLSRRGLLMAAAASSLALPTHHWASAATPAISADMARAAAAWLQLLDVRLRAQAQIAWADRGREGWHYVPRSRPGVPLKAMNERQVAAAWEVLATLLSARGLEQVRGGIKLEQVLGEMTGNTSFRDPGNYALVIFGDPAGSAPWAWRFEGHHLSISVMVAPGHGVGVTPVFFGANPAVVPNGHAHSGFRLLGSEADAAFGLLRSLEGQVRTQATISNRSLGDIVAGPQRELSLKSFEGVPLARLNEAQQAGVMRILELYTGTMRGEIATAALAKVREAGVGALHFAWAGSPAAGKPHYFRIHGPAALIEYDNTQDNADHVHSVWVDPDNLFGRDLLRTHYKGQH